MSEGPGASFDLDRYVKAWKGRVDERLSRLLPLPSPPLPSSILHEAMRYSLFAGGKRLRPLLCIAGCEAVGGSGETALATAAGLELIHTYSLIHDDLPALDNDDFRRGAPTCHKKFGEDIALLAGDGLLTTAFAVIAEDDELAAEVRLALIRRIAAAAGIHGMVAGQVADMVMERAEKFDESDVNFIHERKTADLIAAAVTAGALIGHGSERELRALEEYGRDLGRAFQIRDDVLNVTGGKDLGKGVGTDAARGKATWPAIHGLAKSQARVKELSGRAVQALAGLGGFLEPLRAMAEWVATRES